MGAWLKIFWLPSLAAVAATFLVLFLTQRQELKAPIAYDIQTQPLQWSGRVALAGILLTMVVLSIASARGLPLGLPTALAGIGTVILVTIITRRGPLKILRNVSWSVLPLVAGLFVLVEALRNVGLIDHISRLLSTQVQTSPTQTALFSGVITAISCNLINNLPAGLIAGSAVAGSHFPGIVKSALLIGIDLGPNLSITGSLATILWLTKLRRSGYDISAWKFLKLGALVMVPALIISLLILCT